MDDFEDLAIQAADILDTVENYQFEIGRLANEIVEKYGYKALDDFSTAIEQTSGVKRSASSLRMYAYCYKMATKLEIPKDLLFSTIQAIVFSDDPKKYIEMAKNGASRVDIRKQIYEDKTV